MDYIEMVEKIREELIQMVNQKCDTMIQMYRKAVRVRIQKIE